VGQPSSTPGFLGSGNGLRGPAGFGVDSTERGRSDAPASAAARFDGLEQPVEAFEDHVLRSAVAQHPAPAGVAERKGDEREQLQVRLDSRRQQQQRRVDAPAVEGAEVDRCLEEAQVYTLELDAADERVPWMR